MKRAILLAIVLATTLLSTNSAQAWSEDTHEEMARQSVLYMLRSSNRTLRFVGTIMMTAGEGGKASPAGSRSYPLSEEAKNVDFYNDVTLKNTASTPGDSLFHEFMGHNFTAFNHFLLYEAGGRDTSAWSYDTYPMACEDLVWDAELDGLRKRQAGDFAPACEESCWEEDGLAPSVDMGGKLFRCSAVRPVGYGHVWMDMHDNFGGYSVVVDKSLEGGIDEDGIPSQGHLLRMAGTHDELEEFCAQALDDAIDIEFSDIPLIGGVVDSVLGHIPGLEQLETLVAASIEAVVVGAAKKWLAPMCPSVEGYWPMINGEPSDRHAMARYANNSSTFERPDFDRVSMIDIRWHPVDNLISTGAGAFVHDLRTIPSPPSTSSPQPEWPEWGSGPGDPLKPQKPQQDPLNLTYDGTTTFLVTDDGPPRPGRIAQLTELGRVLHGMSDLAVPGHITGALLGTEHGVMEHGANELVHIFDSYLLDPEETSETGAIEGHAHEAGDSYTLDGLIDVDEARLAIDRIFREDDYATSSMEDLAEDAASRTRLAYDLDNTNDYFDASTPGRQRPYLTRALVNNIVGTVHAMQTHYATYSDRPWNDIIADITWTEADAALVKPPGRVGEFPVPGFYDTVVSGGVSTYNLNIDYRYQEYQEAAGCYVTTHQWCNPEGEGVAFQPCQTKSAKGNYNSLCIGDSCNTSGPTFVDGDTLGSTLTLSSANIGRGGDEIHVTGTYANEATTTEYYRGSLRDSAGVSIELEPGVFSDGIAIWCTGSDIEQERIDSEDENGTTHDAICEIEEVIPTGALACTPIERMFWSSKNLGQGQASLEEVAAMANGIKSLPNLPADKEQGYLTADSIATLAKRFNTSKTGLADALASAHGKVVKVLDPSPWGRASFVWTDDNQLTNIVTINSTGSIIIHRSTKPILLESKS